MIVLVDENIPKRTVQALRALGHSVIDVRESADKAADDERVRRLAQSEQALLVTTDKGFVRRCEQGHHGVLVIRLRHPNRERIHDCIMRSFVRFPEETWPNQTVVVRDRALSVRRKR